MKRLILAVTLAPALAGCSETYDPNASDIPHGWFPYVRNDATYTSWFRVFNRSAYKIDVRLKHYDKSGNLVETVKHTLSPYASARLSATAAAKTAFVGSVLAEFYGGGHAVDIMLEMRSQSGNKAALSSWAADHYVSFPQINIRDLGPGKERTSLATLNISSNPIYVTYNIGSFYCTNPNGQKEWVAASARTVKVSPLGLHVLRPFDVTGMAFTGDVQVEAHSGPDRTGQLWGVMRGMQFLESPTDIGLHSYRRSRGSSAYIKTAWPIQEFFVDVRDDGVLRSDRLIFKNSDPISDRTCRMYFYKADGTPLPWFTVTMRGGLQGPASTAVISPMKLLGQPFSGSVWIQPPPAKTSSFPSVETILRRSAPGKWTDLTDALPGTPIMFSQNTVAWIGDKEPLWHHRLSMFFPAKNHTSTTTDPPGWGGSSSVPPTAGGDVVVIKFFEASGTYLGWLAFRMAKNQTKEVSLASKDLPFVQEPFNGSIIIEPAEVMVEVQMLHAGNQGHASASYWEHLY